MTFLLLDGSSQRSGEGSPKASMERGPPYWPHFTYWLTRHHGPSETHTAFPGPFLTRTAGTLGILPFFSLIIVTIMPQELSPGLAVAVAKLLPVPSPSLKPLRTVHAPRGDGSGLRGAGSPADPQSSLGSCLRTPDTWKRTGIVRRTLFTNN